MVLFFSAGRCPKGRPPTTPVCGLLGICGKPDALRLRPPASSPRGLAAGHLAAVEASKMLHCRLQQLLVLCMPCTVFCYLSLRARNGDAYASGGQGHGWGRFSPDLLISFSVAKVWFVRHTATRGCLGSTRRAHAHSWQDLLSSGDTRYDGRDSLFPSPQISPCC